MKHYTCFIKSFTDLPDWESECDAFDLNEACKIFAHQASGEEDYWTPEEIKEFVTEA